MSGWTETVGSGVIIPADAPDHGERVLSVLDGLCAGAAPLMDDDAYARALHKIDPGAAARLAEWYGLPAFSEARAKAREEAA